MKKLLCLLFTASALSVFGKTNFSYRLHNGDINKTDTVFVEFSFSYPVPVYTKIDEKTETYHDTIYFYNTDTNSVSASIVSSLGINGLGWTELNLKDKRGNTICKEKEYQSFDDWYSSNFYEFFKQFEESISLTIASKQSGHYPFIKECYQSLRPGKYPVEVFDEMKQNHALGTLVYEFRDMSLSKTYTITKIQKIGELKNAHHINAYENTFEVEDAKYNRNFFCQPQSSDGKALKPKSYTHYIYAIDGFVELKGIYKNANASGSLNFRILVVSDN